MGFKGLSVQYILNSVSLSTLGYRQEKSSVIIIIIIIIILYYEILPFRAVFAFLGRGGAATYNCFLLPSISWQFASLHNIKIRKMCYISGFLRGVIQVLFLLGFYTA